MLFRLSIVYTLLTCAQLKLTYNRRHWQFLHSTYLLLKTCIHGVVWLYVDTQTKNIVYWIISTSNDNDSFVSLPSPCMELLGIMDVNLHFLSIRYHVYLKHKHMNTHIHTYSPLQAKLYDKLDWYIVWYILWHAHRTGVVLANCGLFEVVAPLKSFLIILGMPHTSDFMLLNISKHHILSHDPSPEVH